MATFTIKYIHIRSPGFDIVRALFLELGCNSVNSKEQPMYHTWSGASRAHCILEQGCLAELFRFWAKTKKPAMWSGRHGRHFLGNSMRELCLGLFAAYTADYLDEGYRQRRGTYTCKDAAVILSFTAQMENPWVRSKDHTEPHMFGTTQVSTPLFGQKERRRARRDTGKGNQPFFSKGRSQGAPYQEIASEPSTTASAEVEHGTNSPWTSWGPQLGWDDNGAWLAWAYDLSTFGGVCPTCGQIT